MKVFDISDAQPDGRVQELIVQGAEGIILKLGETLSGVPTMDDKFVQFVNEIVAAKLPYGIYYVSHAQDMAKFMEEANFINDKVAELLNGQEPELGTWWDMEVPAVKRSDIWTQLRDAIGTMQRWWNKSNKIGIYAQYSYYNDFIDLQELASYQIPVWTAQYKYPENSLKAEHPELHHVAWQFTTNDENQDENEWYGF
ncbi:GH25 family lysozyme [Pectinatus frisingensis]|uniref:GH25 family lysozyme n=1 Tax=Pectinatus frisingensis TaxID=865 RepID=UPI0018C7E7A2|nr:GH25 family lysozyme [Pectinatus frisingensis]